MKRERNKEGMAAVAFLAGTNTGVFLDGSFVCLKVAALKLNGELGEDEKEGGRESASFYPPPCGAPDSARRDGEMYFSKGVSGFSLLARCGLGLRRAVCNVVGLEPCSCRAA